MMREDLAKSGQTSGDIVLRDIAEVAAMRAMIAPPSPVPQFPPDPIKARAGHDGMARIFPVSEGTTCQSLILGGVECEKITPPGSTTKQVMLYFHGWGYALGSIASHRHLVAQLAGASGATGYILEYRLAPEAPFPSAIQDCVAAYAALIEMGNLPQDIVLAGDSSGAGLAVGVALALEQQKLPQPGCLFLMSPWVDLSLSGASHALKGDVDFMCHTAELAHWATLYRGDTPVSHPLISPIHADLSALAPILIHVGSEEILLSDGVKLAEIAGLCGVEVSLMISANMPHCWHYLWPFVTKARDAIAQAGRWIATKSAANRLTGL